MLRAAWVFLSEKRDIPVMNLQGSACLTICRTIIGFFLLSGLLGIFPSYAEKIDISGIPSSIQDSAEEHLRLGLDFFLTDELDVAIDEFRESSRQRPGYADAYHNLGVALAKTGDLTGALAAWSQAGRLDIQAGSLRYHLSSLVSYNYGISLVRDSRLKEAMEQWQGALRLQPDFPEAHYALGLGYVAAGNPAPAVAHFQEALHLAPDWPDAYEALGLAYYEAHEFDLAEQAWRQALDLKPDLSKVHANLGLLRLQEGNYQEAIRHSRDALAHQPALVAAHYNEGVALLAKGEKAASVQALEMALSLDSRLTSARLLLGVVWSRMGNWGKAASTWREALRQDPFAPDPDGVWLHYNLGLAMTAMGNVDEAVTEFLAVAGQRPEWAPGWSQLGSALMAKRQWGRAVEALETAVRLQPGWAHLHFSIGKAQAEQGKLFQAVDSFQDAVELEPRFVDAWFHLGVVLRAQNRSDEAVEPLRQAAEGGSAEAQSLLASMYANGSGVDRNMPLAMLWWFRSSRASTSDDITQTAKNQLSHLRQGLHRHLFSPNDRQDVLTGFGLIRQDLHRHVPLHPLPVVVVNGKVPWDNLTPTGPVLRWVIEYALALDRSAKDKLHAWYMEGEVGRLVPADPQIRTYFIRTAKEGDPFSCQMVRNFAADSSNPANPDWQTALRGCPEQPVGPRF
jgi:tetratricopeptide (TPR) repeat protein